MDALSNAVVLEIPAELQYVHILGRCACALLSEIDGLCDVENTLYNLELAIQEIGVNIITHAYTEQPGRVVMTAILDNSLPQIAITLHDTGVTFNPLDAPAPALGTLQEHGFGLFLAHELLDDLQYEAHADGNCWHLKKSYKVARQKEQRSD